MRQPPCAKATAGQISYARCASAAIAKADLLINQAVVLDRIGAQWTTRF